ncbi:hypothetical protein GPECTOR_145g742 [Gonium pectorale]|uniref:Uncharacterized protein n=1 Tax=Gonium pectorale TaxID=33097 RepID=A0A150FXV5_GONPE|nr:hypothetical protein GPECTOR_145g742 [Gonium pectorale]|eukprot:KXZ42451.1 hypothetical protein GPECTOR_145g742 [Gonium pectorale]
MPRYGLNRALGWLLQRSDAPLLLRPTKAGWLVVMTACRARNAEGAAVYLWRTRELGLLEHAAEARQVILADLTPFNRYYRDNRGREHLQEAIRRVWPEGDHPAVFDGIRQDRELEARVAGLVRMLGGLDLAFV